MGRTRTNRLTFFRSTVGADGRAYHQPGDLVQVRIDAVRSFSLTGTPLPHCRTGNTDTFGALSTALPTSPHYPPRPVRITVWLVFGGRFRRARRLDSLSHRPSCGD